MYIERTLETFVATATTQFPVVLVTGARQVGKTTILRHLAGPERAYVTLDDPLILSLARTEPALFLQRFPPQSSSTKFNMLPNCCPISKWRQTPNTNQACSG